ncbi:thioredoxin-like protein [Myriangium duriaei CBS 260.36]|uniref:Thioredoxin-like protein n=1 Tax=Myriangium duriaei CBS 260.36 TaxID=1168546 RepID=A0A9P4J0B3_9PEZI|nr:thioredoxin-like protein [Myriangium duriaei CBS 260.36]
MAQHPLPSSLPRPTDDGACSYLPSSSLPTITLPSTSSTKVNLSTLPTLTILFLYPRTGGPGESIPPDWDAIPGARGCTPQACSFRDLAADLRAAGVEAVYGVSAQSTEYQAEAKERLHLPFDLLSDAKGELRDALRFPTFDWRGERLLKRVTLAVREGRVEKVWYPVFPPDRSAAEVLEWLREGGKAS